MKKIILSLFVLIFILTGCSKTKVIDFDEQEDLIVQILGVDKTFGNEIQITNEDQDFKIDVEGMNPWKIQICNIDGGDLELAIGVYKESPHHREMVKRVFIYNIDYEKKRLQPKIRISRLNNPLEDFIMKDLDENGQDNIIALEKLKDGSYQLAAYKWTNFSFDRPYASEIFKEKIIFLDKNGRVQVEEKEKNLYLQGGQILWK